MLPKTKAIRGTGDDIGPICPVYFFRKLSRSMTSLRMTCSKFSADSGGFCFGCDGSASGLLTRSRLLIFFVDLFFFSVIGLPFAYVS